jgi:hypothetical protein
MSIIACGQSDVIPDECPTCGGWLHRVQRGGFDGPHGWKYCEPDCIDDQLEAESRSKAVTHLHARDLLCDCEVCAAAGYPTDAMRAEYDAYRAADLRGRAR